MDSYSKIREFYGQSAYLTAVRVRNEEIAGKRKPTDGDIAETASFLGDFGIKGVEIPDLPTYYSLVRWRSDYAKNWLEQESKPPRKKRKYYKKQQKGLCDIYTEE